MTDRINAFIVVLETDIRDDQTADIKTAILQMRNVLSVSEHVRDVGELIAETRARSAIVEQFTAAMHKVLRGE